MFNCEQKGRFLPHSVGRLHVTELLWFSAVVWSNLLMNTVAIISVTFTTLAAYGHRVGIVRDGVMRTARNQCCLIQHLFVCAHVLGQSTFEQQLLAIAVLQRKKKCIVSQKHT